MLPKALLQKTSADEASRDAGYSLGSFDSDASSLRLQRVESNSSDVISEVQNMLSNIFLDDVSDDSADAFDGDDDNDTKVSLSESKDKIEMKEFSTPRKVPISSSTASRQRKPSNSSASRRLPAGSQQPAQPAERSQQTSSAASKRLIVALKPSLAAVSAFSSASKSAAVKSPRASSVVTGQARGSALAPGPVMIGTAASPAVVLAAKDKDTGKKKAPPGATAKVSVRERASSTRR